jgi:hypothetical protein
MTSNKKIVDVLAGDFLHAHKQHDSLLFFFSETNL